MNKCTSTATIENVKHHWPVEDKTINLANPKIQPINIGNNKERLAQLKNLHHAFINNQPLDNTLVRPIILRSWLRCKKQQVPNDLSHYQRIDDLQLKQLLAANQLLIHAAQSVFTTLLRYTLDAKSHLVLCDKNAIVLYTAGVNITPIGSVLTEATIGTNGIGTCAIEKAPLHVTGAEHYLAEFASSHCSAVPIFDEQQQLIGVMSLAVSVTDAHLHSLGMLEATAITIAQQLKLAQLLQEQQTLLEVLNEGIIIVDGQQRIHSINRYARQLFNISESVIGQPLSAIFIHADGLEQMLASHRSSQDEEYKCQRRDGRWLALTCSITLTDNGHQIVSARDNSRMRALTRRAIGAKARYCFDDIVGNSAAMSTAIFQAKQASHSDSTTLLLGESGTGKELLAQAIHNNSNRQQGPFIVVNCGAIPRDLIQSELFGYEAGAYTGANRSGAAGKFELADGGTIFLDEIGEMPLAAQVNLLRFLQEKEVTRLGSQHRQQLNVRVIAATNKHLPHAVEMGQFRADLFYRINVLTIHVPPLRDRIGDIPLLANTFMANSAAMLNKPMKTLSHETLQQLQNYPWPGNIRELENVIERAMNLSQSLQLQLQDIGLMPITMPSHPLNSSIAVPATPTAIHTQKLETSERDAIIAALKHTQGNLRLTAVQLGISRSGLYNKINRYQLDITDYRK